MKTCAAFGLKGFDVLLAGAACAFLASDAAAAMTGNVVHVDAGYHVVG